jgi:hypothetical protein
MRLASSLMNGLMFQAEIVSGVEGKVLRLETEEILSPVDATFGEFAIVEATDAERKALREAGYELPDSVAPPEGGCSIEGGCAGEKLDA